MKINHVSITSVLSIALIFIFSAARAQWLEHEIDTDISWAVLVFAADIDQDGDLDIAAAGEGDDDVIWYENIGGTPINWTKRIIDDNLNAAIGVYVADIDNDSDPDVVATGYSGSGVVWYENTVGTPIEWTKHVIDGLLYGAACIGVADIDGDDTLDVVATGAEANDVVWYENTGGTPITWTKHFIDNNLRGAVGLDVKDMDNDGDWDAVVTAEDAAEVVWYENIGGKPVDWDKHIIDSNLAGAFGVRAADIDGDDTLDVIAAGQIADDLIWYENHHPIWISHPIDENLNGARSLYVSDINGDDTLDVAVTASSTVVWYKKDDQNFTKHFIDENFSSANDVITADLDDDDDQDVIVSGLYSNQVVWYENLLGYAMVKSVQSNPRYIKPEGGLLVINASLYNPENHPATVDAIVQGEQTAFTDSLQLFDDGLHYDSLASDNIWGNSKWLSGLEEDNYTIGLCSHDLTEDYTYYPPSEIMFTTKGPVVFDSLLYSDPEGDTDPNPGDRIRYYFKLLNEGETDTIFNVSINVQHISGYTDKYGFGALPTFGNIAPDQSMQGDRYYGISFSDSCPAPANIPIALQILSEDIIFWTDTFYVFVDTILSAIEDEYTQIPKKFYLDQNYPNPFNPVTMINYQLSMTNDVELSIYNVTGQKVATLVQETQRAGSHQVEWDASGFASGVYYYRLEAGEFVAVRKMVLLR